MSTKKDNNGGSSNQHLAAPGPKSGGNVSNSQSQPQPQSQPQQTQNLGHDHHNANKLSIIMEESKSDLKRTRSMAARGEGGASASSIIRTSSFNNNNNEKESVGGANPNSPGQGVRTGVSSSLGPDGASIPNLARIFGEVELDILLRRPQGAGTGTLDNREDGIGMGNLAVASSNNAPTHLSVPGLTGYGHLRGSLGNANTGTRQQQNNPNTPPSRVVSASAQSQFIIPSLNVEQASDTVDHVVYSAPKRVQKGRSRAVSAPVVVVQPPPTHSGISITEHSGSTNFPLNLGVHVVRPAFIDAHESQEDTRMSATHPQPHRQRRASMPVNFHSFQRLVTDSSKNTSINSSPSSSLSSSPSSSMRSSAQTLKQSGTSLQQQQQLRRRQSSENMSPLACGNMLQETLDDYMAKCSGDSIAGSGSIVMNPSGSGNRSGTGSVRSVVGVGGGVHISPTSDKQHSSGSSNSPTGTGFDTARSGSPVALAQSDHNSSPGGESTRRRRSSLGSLMGSIISPKRKGK
ncbi:hypothetical protein HDU76_009395 [Blyttiomyces sp. JEL0837]|nr:hypothetical protein HDU76_009395 [Blyttiomyces sp. JEL0837]